MIQPLTPETIAELRRLAEASIAYEPWFRPDDLDYGPIETYEDAAFIAAAAPAVVLALLDAAAERDALAADADKWQRSALTLQGDRDALTDERDSLSWQVEALRAERDARSAERDARSAERDARSAERDALADELSDLREYVATIDQRRDELAGERDALAVCGTCDGSGVLPSGAEYGSSREYVGCPECDRDQTPRARLRNLSAHMCAPTAGVGMTDSYTALAP